MYKNTRNSGNTGNTRKNNIQETLKEEYLVEYPNGKSLGFFSFSVIIGTLLV